jgi:hypothetical protein
MNDHQLEGDNLLNIDNIFKTKASSDEKNSAEHTYGDSGRFEDSYNFQPAPSTSDDSSKKPLADCFECVSEKQQIEEKENPTS